LTENVIRQFQEQFESYGIRPHLSPPPETFVPPIGKINNIFL